MEPVTVGLVAVACRIPRLVAVVEPAALVTEMLPATLLWMTNLPSWTLAVTLISPAALMA